MTLTEGSLHKWFKGSKSKDGKKGWVNVVTGGTCASDKPGEGTPKCVSSSKRASMTKAERLSASRRKKKADPNQQSKSGAAKPTYVRTDSKKKMKESKDVTAVAKELDKASKMHKGQAEKLRKHADSMKKPSKIDEKCWVGYTQKGMKKKGKKVVPNCVKEVAPPTDKHERMVKSIKKSYAKDGNLTKDEKSIAYATAWKNYNKEDWKPEIEHSKLGDAKKKKDKERESKLPPHLQGDALGKMKKAFASEAVKGVDTDMRRMAAQDRAAGKDKKLSPSRGKANVAKMYKDIKHFQKLTKEEVISEKSLTAAQRRALPDSDFVFPGKGEGPEGKQTGAYPINDKKRARAALSMAAAYASPEKEAKVKAAVKKKFPDIQQESALTMIGRTKKKVEKKPEKAMDAGAKARRAMKRREHAKYVSGSTENVPDDMREEKSAFDFVKKQIAAKYGKSGYVSKDNPRKPQTDAEKAKVRAHQAKVDKENAAARAKDPSQGRYPKG